MTGIPSLDGTPHTLEFWEDEDIHYCKIRVTLPDGSMRTFQNSSDNRQNAQRVATFHAAFAVNCSRNLTAADSVSDAEASESEKSSPNSQDANFRAPECNINDRSPVIYSFMHNAPNDADSLVDADGSRVPITKPITFVPATDNDDDEGDGEVNVGERVEPGHQESQKIGLHANAVKDRKQPEEYSDGVDESHPVSSSPDDTSESDREVVAQRKRGRREMRGVPRGKHSVSSGREALDASQSRPGKRLRPERKRRASSEGNTRQAHGTASSANRKNGPTPDTFAKGVQSSFANSSPNGYQPTHAHTSGIPVPGYRQHGQHEVSRDMHNAELPTPSKVYSRSDRIPRFQRREGVANRQSVDPQHTNGYPFPAAPMYQQPPVAPHMPHVPHQGPLHVPPFGQPHLPPPHVPSHGIPHASQYPRPHTAPHLPHPPPLHPASFAPPPGYPNHPVPSGFMSPHSMPNPGFPQPIMPNGMPNAYQYQHQLQNGGPYPFCQTAAPESFSGSNARDNKTTQRESEFAAAVAKKAATTMAAEAAAKDAARRAQSDFRAAKAARKGRLEKNGASASEGEPGDDVARDSLAKGSKATPSNRSRWLKSRNKILVDEVPSEDDDDRDYVSRLNMMAQKGKRCTNLSTPKYTPVQARSGGPSGYQCAMSVKRVPDSETGEGVPVTKTFISRNKKKAKQGAARAILEELDRLAPAEEGEEREGSRTKNLASDRVLKNQAVKSAATALHRLYTLNVLESPPDFRPEEPTGPKGDSWRSVLVVNINKFGKHTFTHDGSSKKAARQMCASKAFNALREMKVAGIESFLNVAKDVGPTAVENGRAEEVEETLPTETIVETSEDENVKATADVGMDNSTSEVLLPKNYKLVVAEGEEDCEKWFAEHGTPGSHLGVFVNSAGSRRIFGGSEESPMPDERQAEGITICFSIATHGIVVRAAREKDESESLSPGLASFRLPDVVVDVLEDTSTNKHGFAVEDGLCDLQKHNGVRAESVNDISITSVAVAGMGAGRADSHVVSLEDLIKLWLKKEVPPITGRAIWTDRNDVHPSMLRNEGQDLARGVLASYACFCLREQMSQAARRKRTQLYGTAAEFLELSGRLTGVVSP